MASAEDIRDRALEYMETARGAATDGHLNAAFELARTACELACKALLERQEGAFPKTHDPSAALHRAGLLPPRVPLARLRALLAAYSRGPYGVGSAVAKEDVLEGLRLAERLLAAFDAANP